MLLLLVLVTWTTWWPTWTHVRRDHWMRVSVSWRVSRCLCTNVPVSADANILHTGVVRAFDEAWQLDKANCPKYNRWILKEFIAVKSLFNNRHDICIAYCVQQYYCHWCTFNLYHSGWNTAARKKSLRQQSYNNVCIIYSDSCNYSSSSMLFNSMMVKFSFVCTATSLAVIKNSHSWFSGPEQPKQLTTQQNN